jgi:hypothetical protein
MPKFILLNGPPRSGKDTAAKVLTDSIAMPSGDYHVYHEKFSAPLKTAFAGMMEADIDDFVVDYYEDKKELPIDALGVSFRQWQIDFSETLMKPKYGNDVFGRLLWHRVNMCDMGALAVYVISDCGFQVEIDYLLTRANPSDVLLLRLQRDGCTFDGDSRGYVTAPSMINVLNESLPAFRKEVREIVQGWLT